MPLITITSSAEEPIHHTFDIERQLVKIGRAEDNDLVTHGGGVSSHHAQVERISGGFILRDLNSTNGMELNGTRMEIVDLVNDIQVEVGDTILRFQMSDEEMLVLNDEPHTPYQRVSRTQVDLIPAPVTAQPEPQAIPTRQRTPSPVNYNAPPRHLSNERDGMGFFGLLGFLVLMLAAFLGGTAARHHHETGGNLYKDVEPTLKQKFQELKSQYESKDS